MKSATKRYISREELSAIFTKANLGSLTNVTILDAGEFNTAYIVTANNIDYVIKIAPNSTQHVLTYEQGIMEREVSFYDLIARHTSVRIPKVYYYDDSKTIIDSPYFIMERLQSQPLTDCHLNIQERQNVYKKLGSIVAELHTIKGDKFGYVQNGLHDNWYLAIKSMVANLCNDCNSYNKSAKPVKRLLRYIDKFKDVLTKVESTYTHFDIWDGNIFYNVDNGEIAIIDTERGFFGDKIGDFVSIEMLTDLSSKDSITTYNQSTSVPLTFSREELIRYNVLRAYLGIIVYTEKFARYKWWQIKYWINVFLAKHFLKQSFQMLEKL